MSTSATVSEQAIDMEVAEWSPGDACPNCSAGAIYAIVRAGMVFRESGDWEFDQTLAVYEAFCPSCDWLPPIRRE
jgi:hypothetical protein